MKSAEVYRKKFISRKFVQKTDVYDRSGVYKALMVRMIKVIYLTNLRMKRSKPLPYRNVRAVLQRQWG